MIAGAAGPAGCCVNDGVAITVITMQTNKYEKTLKTRAVG